LTFFSEDFLMGWDSCSSLCSPKKVLDTALSSGLDYYIAEVRE